MWLVFSFIDWIIGCDVSVLRVFIVLYLVVLFVYWCVLLFDGFGNDIMFFNGFLV